MKFFDHPPRAAFSGQIPWGHYRCECKKYDWPIEECMQRLKEAQRYLKTSPYREVAAWLTEVTGRYISAPGLNKLIRRERSRKQRQAALARWRDAQAAQEEIDSQFAALKSRKAKARIDAGKA